MKKVIIIVVSLLLVVAIGMGAFFLIKKLVSKYNDNGQLMERAKYIRNNELVSKTVNVISYDGVIVESLTLNSFFYTFYDGKDNSLSDSEFEEEVRTKYKYDKKGNCIEEYQCIYRNNMDYNSAYVSTIYDIDDEISYTFVDHDDKEKYSYSEILKTYTYDNKGKCAKETKTEIYYNLNHRGIKGRPFCMIQKLTF